MFGIDAISVGPGAVRTPIWDKAEDALIQAINKGGLSDAGLAWVLVGQSRYERDNRSGAREAFRNANNRGGRG